MQAAHRSGGRDGAIVGDRVRHKRQPARQLYSSAFRQSQARGTLSPNPALTNASGDAQVTLTASSANAWEAVTVSASAAAHRRGSVTVTVASRIMTIHTPWCERGYAMVALLVAMAVMAIVLSTALPVYQTVARREREAELVFRGEQYARAHCALPAQVRQRAAARCRRAGQGAVSPEEVQGSDHPRRFSVPGAFESRACEGHEHVAAGGAGCTAGTWSRRARWTGHDIADRTRAVVISNRRRAVPSDRSHTIISSDGTRAIVLSNRPRPDVGLRATDNGFLRPRTNQRCRTGCQCPGRGGLVAVASKSTETSMRLYNGKSKYNEWIFMALASTTAAGGVGGSQTPGGRGGAAPGGRGGTAPGRGGPAPGRGNTTPAPGGNRGRGGFSPIGGRFGQP